MSNVIDVCNLERIYNPNYQYSLPQKMLESYLSGKAFDNTQNYSQEESEKLQEDIDALYQRIIVANPLKENIAIITAGAPGVGKTVKLKQDLHANELLSKNYAYICPDDVCLQNQNKTYKADLEKSDGSPSVGLALYNKWRPGSNAAAQVILANLILEKYGFYYGMTSSSPATGKFFEFLKKQGYKIRLIHLSAPDAVRWGSIKERDKAFIQTTEQDVREKGLLIPQRINDTYLKYADEIEFYYRDGIQQDAVLTAVWLRNENNEKYAGSLHVVNQNEYDKIKTIHNEAAKVLSRPDLYWETAVEQTSQILQF